MRRLLVLLPLSLLFAACGGSSSPSAGAGPVLQTIQISEKEYSLTPSTVTVSKTGTYDFRVTNNGTIAHALEIEGNGVEEKTGDIQPGASATLRAALNQGRLVRFVLPDRRPQKPGHERHTHGGERGVRRNDHERRRNDHQPRVRLLALKQPCLRGPQRFASRFVFRFEGGERLGEVCVALASIDLI